MVHLTDQLLACMWHSPALLMVAGKYRGSPQGSRGITGPGGLRAVAGGVSRGPSVSWSWTSTAELSQGSLQSPHPCKHRIKKPWGERPAQTILHPCPQGPRPPQLKAEEKVTWTSPHVREYVPILIRSMILSPEKLFPSPDAYGAVGF